jgi:hypothetical protein
MPKPATWTIFARGKKKRDSRTAKAAPNIARITKMLNWFKYLTFRSIEVLIKS